MSTATESQSWLPEPDEASRPFFDGARAGKLRLQACNDCDTWMFPLKTRCQNCGSTALAWRDASGRGTLFSHARLRRAYHPRHRDRLPLILAWIDLDEGARIISNIIDADPGAVKVGMPVQVAFEQLPDGVAIPVFRLA